MKITKGVSNNYELVDKHVVQEDDEKIIQTFVERYCRNFKVDFNNDISITVKLKAEPKLDAQIMSIKLKEQYSELIDPDQGRLFGNNLDHVVVDEVTSENIHLITKEKGK